MFRAFLIVLMMAFASAVGGDVVQFVVYAEEMTTVTRIFPGAKVDFTWNNVLVVTMWTNDAAALIPTLQAALADSHLQVLIPPFTLKAATHQWLVYNLVWVGVLTLVFLSGCTCGAAAAYHMLNMRHLAQRRRMPF